MAEAKKTHGWQEKGMANGRKHIFQKKMPPSVKRCIIRSVEVPARF